MRTLMTVFMLLGAAALAGAQDRLADQLKKGIVQEETSQNPDKAMQAYKAIVAQFDEDRKVAATALYRLAECYRKAGMRPEAQAAYQRIVRDFADQGTIADSSRRQLMDGYGLSTPRGARESDELLKVQAELAATRQALSAAEARQVLDARKAASTIDQTRSPMSVKEAQLGLEMLERRIADIKARVEIGTAAPEDLRTLQYEYQQEVVRYQALLEEAQKVERDRQASVVLKNQTLKSIQAEMKLVEQQIQAMQKKVETGLISPADPTMLQLQRDLLALQRKYDEVNAGIRK